MEFLELAKQRCSVRKYKQNVMMVYGVRNLYNGTSGTELMGKKLGIHAYGNVGRNVARIAKGFGMDIYAFDA